MKRLSYLGIAAVMVVTLSAANPKSAVADGPADMTVSDVLSLDPDDPDVKGVSALIRTDEGVAMKLLTTDLAPGAYTVWWVVFNPGVEGFSAGFAASHVVGPSGTATFAANLRQGEALSLFGSLLDAREAEIHLAVRYHGPVDPLRLDEQLHTFEPATAVNVQFSVHEAP